MLIPFYGGFLVSFEENGGSVVKDQFITADSAATEPADPARNQHIFGGWYTAPGLDAQYDFSAPVTADITLYAKWTELTLSSSVASGTIFTNGRITLTPSVPGGTWEFDSAYFTRDGGTFTALKAGTSTITYTAGGVSATYTVTITASSLPSTGQDMTGVWVAAAGAALALAAAFAFRKRTVRGR